MRENEATERYEKKRTSNLMHSYYAVNSVDGRKPQPITPEEITTIQYVNQLMEKGALFFDAAFSFNFSWIGIAPHGSISVLPKISATPAYLMVNPNYIPTAGAYHNNLSLTTRRPNVCNTTNK